MSFSKGDFWIHAPYIICSNKPNSAQKEVCSELLLQNFPQDQSEVETFVKISFDDMIRELCAAKDGEILLEEASYIVDSYPHTAIQKTIELWAEYYEWDNVQETLSQLFPGLTPSSPTSPPPPPPPESSPRPNIEEPQQEEIQQEEPQDEEEEQNDSQREEPVMRHADFSVHRLGTNIMKHTMVKIPPGSFRMGNHTTKLEGYSEPAHKVHITHPFWITSYPVIQVFYEDIMKQNPSHNQVSQYLPVENISWCEAVIFCNTLSRREGLEPAYEFPSPIENTEEFSNQVRWNREANGYRLPTEAEWEYCARAGGTQRYAGSDTLEDVGWYNKNTSTTQEFGLKKANNWQLYDMCGNVSEWVWDTPIRYYQDEILTDPVHVEPHVCKRIYRGGGAYSSYEECTASFRRFMYASLREKDIGFRLVRNYDG